MVRDPLDLLEILDGGVVRFESEREQLGVSVDRRERIVEIVCDPPGQLTVLRDRDPWKYMYATTTSTRR